MIDLALKLGVGLISFVACSVLYFLGRKSERTDIELKATKEALKFSNDMIDKREKVRSKYDKIKKDLPTSWVDGAMAERLRKKS